MDIKEILNKAFSLGQTYWQQADSEHASQHRKADLTLDKFNEFSLAVEMDIAMTKFKIDDIENQRNDLLEALEEITKMYCDMINSGDCGNWNPETDKEVIKARAAIAAARGEA